MRRLVWAVIIISLIWCAWWFAASVGFARSVNALIEDRQSTGWQADTARTSKHGFPLNLHTRLYDISVSDRAMGIAVEAPQLDLIAAAYWPGFMAVELPNAPILITTPVSTITVETNDAVAKLRLHPGVSLQLQSISLISDAWAIDAPEGSLFSAKNLVVTVTQDNASADIYQFDLNATELKPGLNIRTALMLPIDWPTVFETFTADLSVGFDKVWDQSVLSDGPPQPRTITVRGINAVWGQLSLAATGELVIDPLGIPTGILSVTATNWRTMVDMAEASGALPSSQRVQVEFMASALSNQGGSPDDLNLLLSFQDGQMSLGPINLGPAPRLILR